MSIAVDDFLNRLFIQNKTQWWNNLNGETRQGRQGRFLQETLGNELTDIPSYRGSERQLFFFSQSRNSTIDGLYKHIGVEEKYNNLRIDEDLIDGAIHRGIVWTIGNPQRLSVPKLESISLYVVQKNSSPISEYATDLYFPVLLAIWKIGVHVVFINEDTGEYWKVSSDYEERPIPQWLSVKRTPEQWDKHLENISDKNEMALEVLGDETKLASCEKRQSLIIEFKNDRAQFIEVETGNGTKAAIMDYGNEWRLIELGLLLRSKGYDAVKVIYNSDKHKNAKSRGKILTPAGKMIEKKVLDYMQQTYSVIIDWGVPLDISADSKKLPKDEKQNVSIEHKILHKAVNDTIKTISNAIRKIKKSTVKNKKLHEDLSSPQIIWGNQTHVIDSCVKLGMPPARIASILVSHHYCKDEKSAKTRIKRHLSTDTKLKRLARNIITPSEYYKYLKKYNFPMPKPPYS
jgi:hypothetical protein